MNILVKKSGLMSTLQDLGRIGYQKYGVLVNGAMDSFSSRLANILVGNKQAEAALEMTMLGSTMQLPAGIIFALTGADLGATIDGQPVPSFRPVCVTRDCLLMCGFAKQGCRGYFAVAGGFDVPIIMGSKSTYLRAKIGGFDGRALAAGDVLKVGTPAPTMQLFVQQIMRKYGANAAFATVPWYAPGTFIFDDNVIRITRGQQYAWFTEESINNFLNEPYSIALQSDRMGYRLEGEALQYKEKRELVSEPVTFGSIQVPADGNPIILLADRQTAGGYPKIAQVVCADLPRLAQRKPKTSLHFQQVSLAEAERLYLQQEKFINKLAVVIQQKLTEVYN
ncbi:MAG: biotin-dependent carboxyltransferase family protein [Acidaminococcaceae bacterium]|nr:biotin-dependent carboxyltransferase family protein [Acidaminococcaceae bacterium]MDD4722388.1 biotin-dependent carboxyltransferase family protein [Acidaminococcaceae bacterium]